MFKDNLVNAVHKLTQPSDYDSFLRWTWESDKQRPAIYGDASMMDWSGNLWKDLR